MSRPQSSHGPQASSLRPRNKRLISGLEDSPAHEFAEPAPPPKFTSISSTPFESPYGSRAPSPIPSKHPSRSSSTNPLYRDKLNLTHQHHQHHHHHHHHHHPRNGDQLGGDLATQLSGLWGKSWTSLQGLASNVLGSDETVKDKTPHRQRRPFEATHPSPQKPQWGPTTSSSSSQPGAGSRDERRALVRAQKRQELLMSNAHAAPDARSIKRRTSDDFESASAPPSSADNDARDALVYVHPVTKTDTLPGLSIKYNCPMPVLKKANRMYTDVVQTRTHIVLPVDACGVKGRPCPSPPPPTSPHLGDASTEESITPRPPQHGFGDSAFTVSSPVPATSSPALSHRSTTEDEPWKHDSWVSLDGHTAPTQIARLSRRDLGFFPRARRKSVSYSDLDTPSASFDLPRPSLTVTDTARGMHRKRGSSGSAKGGGPSGQSWAQQMSGIGGVGNLRGKGESAPGPGQDKFTRAVSRHLPSMAPPREGVFLEEEEEEEEVEEGLVMMGNGNSGNGQSLEQLGGAIEGWVRGLGKKVGEAVKSPQQVGQMHARAGSRRREGLGSTGGDLIELSNAFEIGGEEEEEEEDEEDEDERGRSRVSEGRDRSANRVGWDEGMGWKRKGD